VAEQTQAHLPVNDDAAPAFRIALRTGERLGNGIANHYIGTKLLLRMGVDGEACNRRGEHGRAGQRAGSLSRKLLG
jgi:hypothetical protein